MPNNSKITQDITIIEEVFAEKKPTNWKIFKAKHPKTGKVIKVGVIGIGVSCITFAVLGTVILGIVAMLGAGNAAATYVRCC